MWLLMAVLEARLYGFDRHSPERQGYFPPQPIENPVTLSKSLLSGGFSQ
jgi:hypothetical protein